MHDASLIELNNAGVVCMRGGRLRISWDFFKGALELNLACERRRTDPNAVLSKSSENFILRARHRYQELFDSQEGEEQYLRSIPMTEIYGEDENFCHLFLFRDPLEIPNDFHDSATAPCCGLIIILNIALLEHLRNPSSPQIISLYRLAASLLNGKPFEAPLEVIIMNNAGVWCHQSGDTSSAEKYMNRLATLTQGLPFNSSLTPEMIRGVYFNLGWFMNPRYKVSPAA